METPVNQLSTMAFIGALGVLALVVVNKISTKHAFMIGGTLIAIGFITQKGDTPS